jgi:hypothetical protein
MIKCLACHTTNVRGGRDRVGPETADRGIGCEACHGPGGNHLEAVAVKFPDNAILNPASASPAIVTEQLCGRCHSLNEPEAQRNSPRDDPIWLRSQSTTLAWSRCYSESGGALSCLTCHDPHRGADTSAAHYEAKCLSCHSAQPTAADPLATTSTRRTICPVNPAKDCLGCHMPRVENKSLHLPITDHYIRVRDPARPKAGG